MTRLTEAELAEIGKRLTGLRTDRYHDGSAVPCQSVDGHDSDAEDIERLLAEVKALREERLRFAEALVFIHENPGPRTAWTEHALARTICEEHGEP